MADPTRVPVVIGVGDLRSGRAGSPADPREPLDLIHEATTAALADTGVADSAALAARVDTIRAVKTASWAYDDLPGLLADRLGANPDRTSTTPIGILLGGVDFSDLFLTLRQGTVPGPYVTLAAAREAGAVTINYGVFANSVISFLIVAFAVFLLVRSFNKLKRQEAKALDVPPAPPADIVLLTEIRDLLRQRG